MGSSFKLGSNKISNVDLKNRQLRLKETHLQMKCNTEARFCFGMVKCKGASGGWTAKCLPSFECANKTLMTHKDWKKIDEVVNCPKTLTGNCHPWCTNDREKDKHGKDVVHQGGGQQTKSRTSEMPPQESSRASRSSQSMTRTKSWKETVICEIA